MLYSFPTRYKFDPSRYATTEWDNQFFYKNALRSLAPTASSGRKKIVGSLADHRMWLLSERNVENIGSILSDFEKRNVLPTEAVRKLAEEYADPFKRTFFF
ncbi:MAG: hypothetical protein QG650_129 [Patescibacteria group bacterium]|nr:hypothetical protein [Patescibacteria group bacterium]